MTLVTKGAEMTEWMNHIMQILEGSDTKNEDLTSLLLFGKNLFEQKPWLPEDEWVNQIILECLSNINAENPNWTYHASNLFMEHLYYKASQTRGYLFKNKYGNLLELIVRLTKDGIYSRELLNKYTEDDIHLFESFIDPTRDGLFTYIGIRTLADRYLATDHKKECLSYLKNVG